MIRDHYLNYKKYRKLTQSDKEIILDMSRGYYSFYKGIVPEPEFKSWVINIDKIKSAFSLEDLKESQKLAQRRYNQNIDSIVEQMETEQWQN
jgi:hypothetical protein